HIAGPAKDDLCSAVGAIRGRLRHRGILASKARIGFSSVTGGLLSLQLVGTLQAANGDRTGVEEVAESRLEIPLRARNATENVEAKRTMLRKSMASEMRLGEKTEPGDPSGPRKLMPLRRIDGPKTHFRNDSAKEVFDGGRASQRLRRTTKGFDHPLDSVHGVREA